MTHQLEVFFLDEHLKCRGRRTEDSDHIVDENTVLLSANAQRFLKEGTTAEEVKHFSLDMQGASPGRRLQWAITQWWPRDHCDEDDG